MGRDPRDRLERAGRPRHRRGAEGAGAATAGRRAAGALRRRAGWATDRPRRLRLHCSIVNIGIVGLGYVGLPLGVAFAEAGHDVVGLDVATQRVDAINRGDSFIEDVSSERLAALGDKLRATRRYADLAHADAVIIAVPTPLTPNR